MAAVAVAGPTVITKVVQLSALLSEDDMEQQIRAADIARERGLTVDMEGFEAAMNQQRETALALTEGRYHQVRRMFAAVGNHVEALHRERLGGLTLPADLAPDQELVTIMGNLLDNALRHAPGSAVRLTARTLWDTGHARTLIAVADDGAGITTTRRSSSAARSTGSPSTAPASDRRHSPASSGSSASCPTRSVSWGTSSRAWSGRAVT